MTADPADVLAVIDALHNAPRARADFGHTTGFCKACADAYASLSQFDAAGFHVHPLPPEGVISCCDQHGNVVEAEVTNRPQSRMAKAAEVMASGGMSLLMAPPELRYRIPFDRPKIVESSAPNEGTDTGSVKSSESLDRPEPETSGTYDEAQHDDARGPGSVPRGASGVRSSSSGGGARGRAPHPEPGQEDSPLTPRRMVETLGGRVIGYEHDEDEPLRPGARHACSLSGCEPAPPPHVAPPADDTKQRVTDAEQHVVAPPADRPRRMVLPPSHNLTDEDHSYEHDEDTPPSKRWGGPHSCKQVGCRPVDDSGPWSGVEIVDAASEPWESIAGGETFDV